MECEGLGGRLRAPLDWVMEGGRGIATGRA